MGILLLILTYAACYGLLSFDNTLTLAIAPALIAGGISLGSSLLGGLFGGRDKPKFDFSAADIDRMINAYRNEGLEGLRQLGINESQNATARLAASGLEPSLALQQSVYAPILQSLSGARTGLESQLAQVGGNLNLARAQGQLQADLNQPENPLASLFSGIGDIGGLFALRSLFNPGGGAGAGVAGNFTTPQSGFDFSNVFQPKFGLRGYNPGDRLG